MLDVLVGVVIEGFRVSTKGPDQQPPAEKLAATAPPVVEGVGGKNGSSGAGSDSGGGDLDVDWDGGTSSGNSVGGGEEDSAKGESLRWLCGVCIGGEGGVYVYYAPPPGSCSQQ